MSLRRSLRKTIAVIAAAALTTAVPIEPAVAQEAIPSSAQQPPVPQRAPVLLVPGWGDEAGQVEPLRDRLVEAGWPATRVLMLTFSDAVGSNDDHASEVAGAVELLRNLSGSERVDIVAHSMGGLAVRRFLEEGGGESVRRVVFLATPHRGTVAAMLAWGDGGREMVPGSDFLADLNANPEAGGEIEMLAVRSPMDLVVIPNSSAELPQAENVEVCCPTHQGIIDDPEAFRQIAGFLERGPDGLTEPEEPGLLKELRSRIQDVRDR